MSSRISRRLFLAGAAGFAAGVPITLLADRLLAPRFSGTTQPIAKPDYAMPGPFPGRVVEVHRPDAVSPEYVVNQAAVGDMLDEGMSHLTGADRGDVKAAWGRFFQRGDVVGVKVNPVGRAAKPGERGHVPGAVASISSYELVVEVVRRLKEAGVLPQDIVVFERYAEEFIDAGYADLVERELPDVRWAASAVRYSDTQVDVAGFDDGRGTIAVEAERRVAGYDPDVFTLMGFCGPQHQNDERRFRSHMSLIATRMVDKIVTLPVLKDHRSAGVTLALKNLSHGMNNNVSRSHLTDLAYDADGPSHRMGPNQCNTFIPQAASQTMMRQKATLHILDGLIGAYEGGPKSTNKTWATWRRNSLFFATDPVAMDHIGWEIIDQVRAEYGWAPVARMGLLNQTSATDPVTAAAPFGADLLGGMALCAAAQNMT
ncbi:MAG TPA: DUF362 domain-containing protein, partial [Gemmataceae bacterium]|nr:DUF362 domain-containing protein [Gemmataceae bacterium]